MRPLLNALKSAIASLFGVQSARAREADFSGQHAIHYYVIAGVIVCLGFIGILLALVSVFVN